MAAATCPAALALRVPAPYHFRQRNSYAYGDNTMKPLLPFTLAGLLLLSACPDTKSPKAPPKVPEPKAAIASPQALPAAQTTNLRA